MNLHGIVAGAVGAINPTQLLTIQVSTGYTAGADGKRTPTYATPVQRWGQVQPLQYQDIMQVEGLNLQGTRAKIYLNGLVAGLVRGPRLGGDLVTTADGRAWKIAMVTEAWPDWTSAIATLLDN